MPQIQQNQQSNQNNYQQIPNTQQQNQNVYQQLQQPNINVQPQQLQQPSINVQPQQQIQQQTQPYKYPENYYDIDHKWSTLDNQYNTKFEDSNQPQNKLGNLFDRFNNFENDVNSETIQMYPGEDNKMHVKSSIKRGDQTEEEEESIDLDGQDIFASLLDNLVQDLDGENPFQLLSDELMGSGKDGASFLGLMDSDDIIDLENNSMENQLMELNQEIHLSMTPRIYQIPENVKDNRYLMISIKGEGTFMLDIYDKQNDKVINEIGKVEVFDNKRDKLIPVSTKILKKFTGKYLRIRAQTLFMAKGVQAMLSFKDFINLKFQQSLKIETSFVHSLKLRVSFQKNKPQDLSDLTRLQFILKTNLNLEDIKGNEKLMMFINQGKEFPTAEKFDLYASGSLNSGLIKTITSNNKSFCIQENCIYSLLIKVRHIDQLTLFASNVNNGQRLKVKDYLHLVEELEPGEQVRYLLEVSQLRKNYQFSLYPTENNTVIHVQPDQPPSKNTDQKFKGYSYMSFGEGVTKMIITQKELDTLGLQGNLFYIAFEAKDPTKPSTFYFEFKELDPKQVVTMEENEEHSGLIVQGETTQYHLNLFNGEPESFDIDIKMKTFGGQAQIFLKECRDQEKDCKFTQQDFQQNTNKLIRLKSQQDLQNQDVQNLNMKVNCLGNDPFEENQKYQKDYPISVSCKFVLTILNPTQKYVNYQLTARGNTVLKELQVGKSHTVTLNPFMESNFRFQINKQMNFKTILIKFVSLVGDCTIYISNSNKYPDKNNNNGKLEIKNKNLTSIQTQSFDQFLNKQYTDVSDFIYLSIFADSYTVLDIYSDYIYFDAQNANQIAEKLTLGQIAYRSIKEKDMYKDEQGDVFYKDFIYFLDQRQIDTDFFDIQLNSEVIGLELCVQQYNYFDQMRQCDFKTTTENLKIDISNNRYKPQQPFFIRVYKKVNQDDYFENFPIEFNLLIHSDKKDQRIQQLRPGQIISKKLDAKESAIFKIEFQQFSAKTTILFTSHTYYLKAKVKNSQTVKSSEIATLTSTKFGLRIENQLLFKKKYCTGSCKIFVEVENLGNDTSRFYLGFVHDHTPLILKEGEQIFIPADRQFYMVTKPKNKNPLEMTYQSTFTQSVLLSKIVHQFDIENQSNHNGNYIQVKNHLSENQFDYKTDIGKSGEIIINKDQLLGYQNPQVLYLIIPKFNTFKVRKEGSFAILDEKDKTSITLHSSLQKLNFNHEVSAHLSEGDFKYFTFNLDEPQNMTIIVTSVTGEKQVYVNKGLKNLPTEKSYWKKGDNFSTKEIVIQKEEFQHNLESMVDTYTVGVFAQEDCQFNILVMKNFDNLIKIKNQELKSYQLQKLQVYFFDFYSDEPFHKIFIYSDQSDVEISFLRYDEGFGENILSQLKDETNVDKTFIQKANSLPYLQNNNNILNVDAHFIVRARPLNSNTNLDVAIFDTISPLLIKSESRVTIMQDKLQQQIYQVKLKYDMEEADIDIKQEFGQIDVYVSFNKEFNESYEINGTVQKSVVLQGDKQRKNNDIVIFQDVFIKIVAKKKSKFSILVKPKDKFKKMKLMETEIIRPLADKDLYLYLEIDSKLKQSIQTMQIEVETVRGHNQKIQYLFNSDSDIKLNENNPFIDMPIIDQHQVEREFTEHKVFQPQIMLGYYVIKIPPNTDFAPIKLSFNINNEKKLEVNGEYYEKTPKLDNQNKYFIYIPEAGEFRILLEYCAQVKLEQAVFLSDNGEKMLLEFKDNLVQDYPYIFNEDDSSDISQRTQQLQVPVYRGTVDSSGLLSFVISNSSNNTFNVSTAPQNFYLLTEFKPNDKQLIFKDYIDYYPEKKEFFNFEFLENNSKLKITAIAPKFKKQLLQDYPNLKHVFVDLRVYLLGDDDRFISSFQKCGLAIVDRFKPKPKLHTYSIKTEIDKLNDDHKITFTIGADELSKMKSFKKLILYSHARISFMEREETAYYITLDRKFTDVPYYLLKIDNMSQSLTDWSFQQIRFYGSQIQPPPAKLSFSILFVMLFICLCIYLCNKKSQKNKREIEKIKDIRDQYIKKDHSMNNMQEDKDQNKIEMADI